MTTENEQEIKGGGHKKDLCPRCEAAELVDLISKDGSCIEADECPACGATWWNDPPILLTHEHTSDTLPRVINPEAIGNPDVEPIIEIPEEMLPDVMKMINANRAALGLKPQLFPGHDPDAESEATDA